MAVFKINCPHCGADLEVQDEWVNMETACPYCSKTFIIPGRPPVNPEPVKPEINVKTPSGPGVTAIIQDGSAAGNSRLYPCPDCSSLISKRAAVCPKCGAPLGQSEGRNVDDLSPEMDITAIQPEAMNYLWFIVFGVLTIAVGLGIYILITTLIEIYCTKYILTSRRIIIKKGWISKTQNEIWIKDMRAANLMQGMWQRLIGTGNIAIGTAASAGTEINIVGIRNPQSIIDMINGLRKS